VVDRSGLGGLSVTYKLAKLPSGMDTRHHAVVGMMAERGNDDMVQGGIDDERIFLFSLLKGIVLRE
jgi:hypothetical protein